MIKVPFLLTWRFRSGVTYHYRFESNNSSAGSWSSQISRPWNDQGTLRFHTGNDETGTDSGLFWDKENGQGEQKVANANFQTDNFLAPDGSSWSITKAIFNFSEDLLIGENLNQVILEGVNSLSIQVEGNVSISHHLIGATSFHPMLRATLIDGHDSFYDNDPAKGLRVGQGQLGGYSGGQGPGKGKSLGNSGAGGLSGGGGSYSGEGGAGSSGPSGQTYGTGGLDFLLGGSGGGFGNFGDAAAGGGALEILASGKVIIDSGVKVSMNGGAVLVNPSIGANFSESFSGLNQQAFRY